MNRSLRPGRDRADRRPRHNPLVFGDALPKLAPMWKFAAIGSLLLGATVFAQPPQLDLANLREDVRGLDQRLGDLQLRVEQLERRNSELARKADEADRSAVTLVQLNDAIASLTQLIKSTAADTKADTLAQVSVQLEKLGKQTNAALDSLAKGQATRAPVQTNFSDDYPKVGVSYTVQRGDTLAEIAKKTGAKLTDIVNANKLSDPSRITVGQTLFIPGGK